MIDGKENEGGGATPAANEGTKQATDAPKLVFLPARMQRKGMFYVTNNLQILMSIVRAAENGIEKEELLQQVGEDAPTLKRSSQQNILSQAVSLNLVSVNAGTYRTTSTGQSLLEGQKASDMLTPIFARNIFGFALIICDLRDSSGLSRGEVADRARSYYPGWTTDFAPNSLVAWLRDLGLANIQGNGRAAQVQLTEAGEYWASGLPKDIKTPDHLLADDDGTVVPLETEAIEGSSTRDGALTPVKIDAVLSRFKMDDELRHLVFGDDQIRLVHAALHSAETKRFILLAGLSGTGKTSMARAYARAYCDELGLPFSKHYKQITVWPDWTDPSGLLGFVNPLANPPSFQETAALTLLLGAAQNPSKPYFLCLDEMNLARVEHYFAPFLSAMEGRGGELSIHNAGDDVYGVPSKIAWPSNLFIIGTVNMDETTYPFSDKVLDRAFTFEFWDVDLSTWREKAAQRAPSEGSITHSSRHVGTFGYRTCDEVLGFCIAASGLAATAALDAAVLAKVLPKIRGDFGANYPRHWKMRPLFA